MAGWAEYAERLPAQVDQQSVEGRALGQGGLVRFVFDYAKGGVFWTSIVDGTFLVVVTIDQTSMEAGRAHAFVTRLEKMMRDHTLIGG
ncbi:MAG TPA: hypothetical protein VMZ71_02965 [Gemmataceae bacterium]|nr:hypothetical protein [Gemmataceae bacterium]